MNSLDFSKTVNLCKIVDPNLEASQEWPELPVEVYHGRLSRLHQRMEERQFEAAVIYGDREHAANFSWLTGIEPRFEEAIAVVVKNETPTALLGNECLSLTDWTPAPLRVVHWPPLSLISQPREALRPLADIFGEAGIGKGDRIGLAGWKYYAPSEFPEPGAAFECPHYLVEALREIAGENDRVKNVSDWFMSPEDGLRTFNEPAQIAQFETAGSLASNGISRLIQNLELGRSELELAEHLVSRGLPLSCHPMVSSGRKAQFGLTSPSSNVVKLGDAFTTAFGICGGLSCRAGYVAESPSDLPTEHADWLDRIAKPFFAAVCTWYETIRVGLPGGELFDLIESMIPRTRFGWTLNPGHLLGMDEWISSPVFPGSQIPFRSGMAVQMDIIPAPPEGCSGGNVEDGIILADESLRKDLADQFPQLWERVQQRRRFMQEELGIALDASVLPVSNTPALWRPLLLNREEALACRK